MNFNTTTNWFILFTTLHSKHYMITALFNTLELIATLCISIMTQGRVAMFLYLYDLFNFSYSTLVAIITNQRTKDREQNN